MILSALKRGVLSLCLLQFLLLPALALEIHLTDQCQVSSDKVLLRDLAAISPEGSDICRDEECVVSLAPQPGQKKTISLQELHSRLHRQLIGREITWTGATEVQVERTGIRIDEEKFKEILAGYLQENLNRLPQAEVRIATLQTPGEFFLPDGQLSWQIIPSASDIINSSSFNVQFQVDGTMVKNCSLKVRFEAMAEIATAATTLRRETIIAPDQIRMQRMDLVGLKSPFLNREEVEGLLVTRTISSGRVIQAEEVAQPPVIAKGEQVRILANKGSLILTATGIAYASGHVGDTIRVRNVQSNKLILGRVAAPGTVAVEF